VAPFEMGMPGRRWRAARETVGGRGFAGLRRRHALALAAIAALCAAPRYASAAADPASGPPGADARPVPSADRNAHRTFGFSMDLGVPDGAALAFVVRPLVDWVRLSAAVTYNGAAPGARAGLTIDPVPFSFSPTLTAEAGHTWNGPIPGFQGSTIGYDYANFHFGIEVGRRETIRFFLRGGVSWLDFHTAGFQAGGGSASSLQNPGFAGWVAPSAKLGFAQFF